MKSIEGASRHEERENRQVCAGTFGSGVCTSRLHNAKSSPLLVAIVINDFSVVIQVSAPVVVTVTGFFIGPLEKVAAVEHGIVREDKGVVGGQTRGVVHVPYGDPQKDFAVPVFFAERADSEHCLLFVFTVK